MKVTEKTGVRIEMTDQDTQKIVKQNFSNVRADQSDEALLTLAEVVGELAKEKADIQGTYQVVEYQILKDTNE
ncbi:MULTISPECIES: hypothetical protein [Enterococcus]|uniref:DUF1659 domain-containing protein n=1 Tax=Enterococcus sulfureus ATCC 49903 TaxID=1140003 RepID=S0L3Q8_9ENTE|nr:hypothetical protein [Enterococcus sulfureus]EOT51492.1 hypothetical protein OMY_00206 [Enterococcus sulfureus ATCC 49903]EOT87149.1 hypothetical protein I573_00205 [Enterococcus sulfureus ATCC 49903]